MDSMEDGYCLTTGNVTTMVAPMHIESNEHLTRGYPEEEEYEATVMG